MGYNSNCLLKMEKAYNHPLLIFFNDRPNSYTRMVNFIIFYSRFLNVNNIDIFFRYSLYLIFLNLFYIYLAITRHQAIQLMAIPGTIAGLFQITFDKKLTKYAKS